MNPRFTKGQPIRASDLNALADAACMNIIGGPGCAITRLGKKIVVNKRLGQKIRRGNFYGNVWKLNASNGALQWGFDTGDFAYSVCAAPNGVVYVAGKRNNNWSDGGAYASVWCLSSNGNLVWAHDGGANAFEVHATDDAVFVYGHSSGTIVKLDPSDGTVLANISITTSSGGAERHGFGINSTQLWTWGAVSSVQGLRAYDHDLNSIYAATPPPATGLVDQIWGIGVSEDLVTLGTVYSDLFPSLGITNEVLGVLNTNNPPATQFAVAETVSGMPVLPNLEAHYNVDCETNYVVADYYSSDGNRPIGDTRQSFVRLYDLSGIVLHDIWLNEGGSSGGTSPKSDVAIDESLGLFFYAATSKIAYMEGVQIDPAATDPYRTLFAFDIDTGAISWKWTPAATKTGTGDNTMYSVFSDRAGHIYATCQSTAREPFMKRGD